MTNTESSSVSKEEKTTQETSQANKTVNYDGQLNITVRTIDSDSYPVVIAHSETVLKLKEQLEDVAGVTRERQRLIFQGRVMKDEKTLHECGLQTGNVIHLVIRPLEALGNNGLIHEPQSPQSSSARHRSIMSPSGFMVSTISLEPEITPINSIFSSIFGGSPRNPQASPLSAASTPTSVHSRTPRGSNTRPNGTPSERRSTPQAQRQTADNSTLFNRASTHLRRVQDLWNLTPEYEIQGNDTAQTGRLMLEYSNALEHLIGVLRPLARTFMDETAVTDPQELTRVQDEAVSVARGIYRLTQLESTMATILHRTRFTPTSIDTASNNPSPNVSRSPEASASETTTSTNQAPAASTPNQRPRSLNPFFSSPGMTLSVYPDISLQIETSSGATIPISLPMTPTSNQPSRERNQDPAPVSTPETQPQPSQQQASSAQESNPPASSALSSLLSSILGGSSASSLGSPFTTILPSRSSGGSSSFIASTTIPFVSIIPASRIGQARGTSNSNTSTSPNNASDNTSSSNGENSTSSQTTPRTNASRPDPSNSYNLGLFGAILSNYLTLLEESQSQPNVSVAEALGLEPSSTNRAHDFIYQLFHSIRVAEAHEIIRGNPSSLQQLNSRLSGYFQANISTERSEDIINLSQSLSEYLVAQLHLNEALPNNDTIIESLQDRLKRYLAKQCERLLRFLLDAQPKRRASEANASTAAEFVPNWVREVVQEVRNDFFNAYGNDRTREIVHLVVKHHLQSLCSLLSLSATRFLNELEHILLDSENSEASSLPHGRDDDHNPGESSTNSAKRRKLSDS